MGLLTKIKEAHQEGLRRYESDRRLLSSPVYLLATAVEKVVPGTIEDLPSKPDPLKPLAGYYRPTIEYLRGFYETLKK